MARHALLGVFGDWQASPFGGEGGGGGKCRKCRFQGVRGRWLPIRFFYFTIQHVFYLIRFFKADFGGKK